jgi:glycosidase
MRVKVLFRAILLACAAIVGTFLLLAFFDTQASHATDPVFNEDDIVYMILTDRFYDGDSTNNNQGNGEYDPGDYHYYQGGDWQGVISKTGYITNLGVTSIWISPVSDDQDLSKDGNEAGYHGYFTYDYYAANPHFGTTSTLVSLANTVHNAGLDLILDVVPNHTGDYLEPYASVYSPTTFHPAAPFDDPDWYHHNGTIDDWNDQWEVEYGDIAGLDDLAQELVTVTNEITKVHQYWFDLTGAEAARVDAARSMSQTFLAIFEDAIGVPTFGEVFHGDIDYVSEYQDYEWGVLDFPLFFQARDVFAYDSSFSNIANIFDQDYKYNNANRLLTFVDNHDRDRFIALADDNYRRMRLAMTFLFTARGIPVVYYGTEQAMYGDGKTHEWQGISTYYNRMPMQSWDQNNIIYKHIQRLAEIRKDYIALRRGTQREMWEESSAYAYSRRYDSTGQEVITVMTNGWDPVTRTIPLRSESTITVNTVLTNLLDTRETVTVGSGGTTGKQITVTLEGKEAMILAPDVTETYTPMTPTLTTIRVHYNAGLDNSIWIRGSQYPFWWDDGRSMRWTTDDVWEWETERIGQAITVEVKPLINDYTWSVGSNFVITGGEDVDIYPSFHDSSTTTTRIRVHYDVGSGNSIYIRGSTSPLSWNSGQQATWTEGNVWTWETTGIGDGSAFEFKPLVNDSTWSQGTNYKIVGGSTADVFPKFYANDSDRTTETIRVVYDVGLGNSIYIRGSTSPLSWSSGQQASWTAGDVWVWETTSIGEGTQFEFKPLKNDTTWSQGNNYWSRGGLTVEIYPSFP